MVAGITASMLLMFSSRLFYTQITQNNSARAGNHRRRATLKNSTDSTRVTRWLSAPPVRLTWFLRCAFSAKTETASVDEKTAWASTPATA